MYDFKNKCDTIVLRSFGSKKAKVQIIARFNPVAVHVLSKSEYVCFRSKIEENYESVLVQ